MERMNGETLNIVADNIQKLKEIFPQVFNEDKVDFEKLEAVLGEYKDNGIERYNFLWPGKSKAIRIAQTPSTGTLRPCREESKDWDTTQNLYIEGDNLEVLKLLQKSYYGKVKMIYIDPPYNTGNDFVYKDDFKDNIENYLELTGQKDSEGNKTTTNTEANGRYHSNWLNMMYPRLKLARNLLSEDGVIFISIGQDELDNQVKLCNEIWGESNCLGIISRQMKAGGGSQGKYFSHNIDYVIVYAKRYDTARYFRGEISEDLSKKVYNQLEQSGERKGEYYRAMGLYQSSLGIRPGLRYWIECPDGTLVIPPGETLPSKHLEGEKIIPNTADGVWRWSYEKYIEEKNKGNIEFKKTTNGVLLDNTGKPSEWNVYTKIWLKDRQDEGQIPSDIITKYENRHSSKELTSINIPFDFAKPSELIKYLIYIMQQEKDIIILDFFSGSASTSQAVMKINSEDNGTRKFIMVQIPEKTDEKSEAYKSGYKNICEIGKERIRRAGEKIKEENKDKEEIENLDIGFKVFKLDSSNINKWDSSYEQDLEHNLLSSIENIKKDRTEEDVLYEILLKYGIDLNMPIEEHLISSKKVFSIGLGAIFACLNDEITLDVVEGIGKLKEELKPETCRVVFMDNGFETDSVKTNTVQILKRYNIDDVKCI
ncbi:site-specific DNA-methyltransferase [Hathewaya limosa]|uniref:Adenine-specific DNA-methyltransferase n=1 Tax=Hathewaya limosa TaxID=1536 RepID=A0ABU0JWM4_HATLI|nr:site-specific DNA-methyltransferase [Hathewaya limosa]MDQ0480504.1 adenine-specific DNA-methyltransferase [Hathewaya limosa]